MTSVLSINSSINCRWYMHIPCFIDYGNAKHVLIYMKKNRKNGYILLRFLIVTSFSLTTLHFCRPTEEKRKSLSFDFKIFVSFDAGQPASSY